MQTIRKLLPEVARKIVQFAPAVSAYQFEGETSDAERQNFSSLIVVSCKGASLPMQFPNSGKGQRDPAFAKLHEGAK